MSDALVIVTGEFEIEMEDLNAVKAAMQIMATETAKEDGCIHYRFYQDIQHPEWLHVYEEWESEAHLAAHAASAHMATFRATLADLGVKTRYVRKIRGEPGEML